MAWSPIDLITIQYQNPSDNTPASGFVLKAFAAGTSTNIPMATDDTGATQFNDISLNSDGNPEHLGSVVVPHIDQRYKISFFATQAAADANTPAIWSIDNLTPPTFTGSFTTNDAISGAVTDVIDMTHTTSGTPVAGIGTGISFSTETADDNTELGMQIHAVTTDVSSGSEDFKFLCRLMVAGTIADAFECSSTGQLSVKTGGSYAVNGTDVLTATALGSGVLASSLTSLGTIASLVATTADINAGTVDAVVGGTTPAAGTFTDLASTGNTTIGNATGDALTYHPSAWTLTNAVTITGTWADLGAVTTVDINGGTVDGATIGGASAGAGTFTTLIATTIDGPIGSVTPAAVIGTTLKADTSLELASGATVTAILDEDDMTSNSATALATQQSIKAFVDAAAVTPALEFISATTASNDATIEFSLTGSFAEYELHCLNVIPATDDQEIIIRTSTDSGVSFDAGASDYGWRSNNNGATATLATDAEIRIAAPNVGNVNPGEGVSVWLTIIRPAEATFTAIQWQHGGVDSGGNFFGGDGFSQRLAAEDVTDIQVLFESGNVTSGLFALYGVNRA